MDMYVCVYVSMHVCVYEFTCVYVCTFVVWSIGVALLVTLQTFDVLKAVGKHHTMSAGLVIGGKDLRDEQRLINAMMILVKPGRRCTVQTD